VPFTQPYICITAQKETREIDQLFFYRSLAKQHNHIIVDETSVWTKNRIQTVTEFMDSSRNKVNSFSLENALQVFLENIYNQEKNDNFL